jgi:hypothetical protein
MAPIPHVWKPLLPVRATRVGVCIRVGWSDAVPATPAYPQQARQPVFNEGRCEMKRSLDDKRRGDLVEGPEMSVGIPRGYGAAAGIAAIAGMAPIPHVRKPLLPMRVTRVCVCVWGGRKPYPQRPHTREARFRPADFQRREMQ